MKRKPIESAVARTPKGTPKRPRHNLSLDPNTVEMLKAYEAKTGAPMSQTVDRAVLMLIEALAPELVKRD